MKKYFFILLLLICSFPAMAKHVAGGELFYEFIKNENGFTTYQVTLRLFRDCQSTGPLLENEVVTVGVYDNTILVQSVGLPRVGEVTTIQLNTAAFPCLVGNPSVCYQVALYISTITVKNNVNGYTLSRLGCCRVDRITNLYQQTNVGSNYVTRIPGTGTLPTGHNSSPQFNVRDTALVCANKSFKLDFGAVDPDGDSLTYSFCDAYTSGGSGGNTNINPTPILSLISLPYGAPYSGQQPLGSGVKINAATGIIGGIAPASGSYVVNVCITEWRNGKAFTEHRKDFILKVQDCDIIEAVLPDKIVQCKDSIVQFENLSTSSSVISYLWDFGDGFTSSAPTVAHGYIDTGTYKASLTVTGPKGCVGTASTEIVMYPGFIPAFTVSGSCFMTPFHFNDSTYAKYGVVNSWRWDFGDLTTDADTSLLKNALYKYATSGTRNVSLIVTSSKGCIDSVRKDYDVRDKPSLQLPFHDTLICDIDTLPIHAPNPGVYSWVPNKNILYANTADPLLFPKDTTQYIVTLSDNGCVNSDTVTVNVLHFITVELGLDSVVCKSDPITLHPVSHALSYHWTASSGEIVNSVKNPVVHPSVNTKYYVTANLGKCEARDSIALKVVPYPVAVAGPDTVICFGTHAQLHSSIVGSSFSWSPSSSLSNAGTLSPLAAPAKTTAYILKVLDTLGCTKPSFDTTIVTVSPPVNANAGRDTSVLPGQPVQLQATGGQRYIWSPEIGLNNPSIANPIATLSTGTDSIRYRVRVFDQNGCYAEDDIVVRVYNVSGPEIFVPSAFTPNGDGRNDVLKPVSVGITQLNYFNVYNRWGQLLFTTTEMNKGWDGTFNGTKQPSDTYVFTVEGVDYEGKTVFRKGTSVLIR